MDDGPSRYDKLESMLQDGSSGLRNLPLDYLKSITNNFSDERLLGEGGFGTVYKGVLPSGETIAVKKLNSPVPGVKDRHFENEAYHLMRLKHPNVVLLVGWCSETEDIYVQYNGKYICAEKSERLLCLEYMPKGSLRGYLSDEASGLGGDTRYKIIEGICYGLHYLHEKCQHNGPIIHMDLKPANILLENIFLSRRHIGVRSNDHCVMCSLGEDETLNHLLFTCPFERSCWAAIHVAWDLSVSLENRIIHGIQHSGLEFFVELALIAAWELWKLRNDKIFNRHEPSFARWLHNFKAQCRLQEIALLSQFEHENIVQYYDTDKEDSKLYIFLELVTQGSLASLYQKYHLQDTHVSAYTRQILNGLLSYLHERNIVHRSFSGGRIGYVSGRSCRVMSTTRTYSLR